MKRAILTCEGEDRPGVFSTASNYLKEMQANLIKSFGYVVSKDYSNMSLEFDAPDKWMQQIEATYKTALTNLHPHLRPTAIVDDMEGEGRPIEYRLNVHAPDEPGIAAAIVHTIAEADINIVGIQGESETVVGMPSKIYNSTFELKVPSAASIKKLRECIFALESKRCWDIDLHPLQLVPKPKYVVVEKLCVPADSEVQGRSHRMWD